MAFKKYTAILFAFNTISIVSAAGLPADDTDRLSTTAVLEGHSGKEQTLTAREYIVEGKFAGFPKSETYYRADGWADQKYTYTPNQSFLRAAFHGDIVGCERLVGEGADINVMSSVLSDYAYTALQMAVSKGNIGLAQKLLDLGANVNARLVTKLVTYRGEKTRFYNSPLHIAAFMGNRDMVELLLRHPKIDPGLFAMRHYNNTPRRPYEFAAERGHRELAEFLFKTFRFREPNLKFA